MWHGMPLFLIGLLTGFAETHYANTRMALAADLEGVMNGILLLALGAVRNEVRLAPRTKNIGPTKRTRSPVLGNVCILN